MRHPLHPMSVHAPIACILFTPIADSAALALKRPELWALGGLCAGAAVALGVVAATFGALDFDRAHAKAPRTVSWHAGLMATALLCEGAGLAGRVGASTLVATPPPWWSIAAGFGALGLMLAGAYLGGDLVYRHGVNVASARD